MLPHRQKISLKTPDLKNWRAGGKTKTTLLLTELAPDERCLAIHAGQSLSALLLIDQAHQLRLLLGTLKASCLLVKTLK